MSLDDLWTGAGRGPLAGVRVADFGQYLAGPLLAMLLADQGAEVIRIDPPGGPRWASPSNAVLLRGRRHIVLDLKNATDRVRAQKLVASADVLVENFRPGVMDRLGLGESACRELGPGLIYCSLPGFGSDDPRAEQAAWEGVVMAAAGAYSLGSPFNPTPDRTPVFSPLPLGSVFAAIEGAMAVTAALIGRERDGLGQRIEVPLYDALFEACGVMAMTYERNRPAFGSLCTGFFRCRDGRYLTFISSTFRHLEWFVRAAGCEKWIEEGLVDYQRLLADADAKSELRRRMVDLFLERPAAEWESLGRAHGCTMAMMRSMEEWLAERHAIESDTLMDSVDPELGAIRGPALAVELSTRGRRTARPRQAPGSDDASILPLLDAGPSPTYREPDPDPGPAPAALHGVRVLDFTRVVAAPTTSKLLAQLGADVIKLDTDPARHQGIAPEPLFHEHLNRGKRSLMVDLRSPEGRQLLPFLVASCDVVVQNFTLGVAGRLGIEEGDIRRHAPSAVYTYLNAFGTRGPWANCRGYAELANVTTGITDRTLAGVEVASGVSAAIDLPRWIFTDYGCGVLGAFATLLGLYERARTGIAPRAETSLVRMTALEQIPYLIDFEGRSIDEPRGSVAGWSDLQRIYPTKDGALFVGARPEQLPSLLESLAVERLEQVAAALADRTTIEAREVLTGAGIGAHEVMTIDELMAPGSWADRRGLRQEDRSDSFGAIVMPGPVARLSRTPMRAGALPEPFGADGAAILAELTSDAGWQAPGS